MKTITTFLSVTILLFAMHFGNPAQCKEVNKQTAKNVALNIYAERSGNNLKNVTISKVIEEKENGITCLYIVVYSDKGFAVVSADDIVQPVLGYSFDSYYDENNIAPGFEFFVLKRFRKQIYAAKQAKIQPEAEIIEKWNKYSISPVSFQPKAFESSTPLLTTIWHQKWPYNAHCPADTAGPGDHVVVGCVATAMAQVLNYWQHPWHGTGSHSYTPENHPEYGVQEANFGSTYYNFDNMPDNATTYSEDLADLNYHCGVAVDMNYGPDGSGAWGDNSDAVSSGLKNYFYISNDATDISRSDYSDTEWTNILNSNINANRPVIYGSHDSENDSGHAWVIDAVSEDDEYHCNWGWGGNQDGWFSIDNLKPDTIHYYDSQHHASINIHPKTGTLSGTLTQAGSPYTYNYDQVINSGSQLIIEPGVEILFNGRYKFIVKGQLLAEGYNGGFINFNAQIPEIGMQGIKFEDLNNNSMDTSKLLYCYFENGRGTYDPAAKISTGGGIFCDNSAKILIEYSRISDSKADYGGGIACTNNSGIRLHHTYFENDTASLLGGGMLFMNSDAVLSENHITGNYISEDFYSNGGGIYCLESDVSFDKDVIDNNHSPSTGGIYIESSDVVLDSVIINNNISNGYAGGLSASANSTAIFNNCQIYDNQAVNDGGGALYITGISQVQINRSLFHHNHALYGNSIVLEDNSTISINNCTLADNKYGSKNSVDGVRVGGSSNLNILNSILWDNGSEEIFKEEGSFVNISYSAIKNGDWTGTGVTSGDPLFHSPETLDYSLTWEGFPIPDEKRSSGIDSGDPSSPADPDGTRADMGCIPYEQTYTSVPAGDVSGTFTCANSPYYVFGDIEIPVGDELIIEPCVTVLFQGDYKFEVRGRLLAEGTSSDRITFAVSDTVECWQGINFIWTSSNGQDSSKLVNCRITFGYADRAGGYTTNRSGGAVSLYNSPDVLIKNCLLNKNHATEKGGAIYIEGSNPSIIDNIICNNSAPNGGAIFSHYATLTIQGGVIEHNEAEYGGAFYFNGADPTLSGVTIRHNKAKFGGGIYMYGGSTPVFDPVNLCNLYMNYAYGAGLDLCGIGWNGGPVAVNVDTFSVINPNSHFAYPFSEYTFNIQNGVIEQTNQDLYVSMSGSDENTGTDPLNPLKTLYMAMMKIMADETDTAVVYLATGGYSEDLTGEVMPVNWRGNVSLIGTGMKTTGLYGDDKNQILYCYDDSNFYIRDLSFQNGYAEDGGAVYFDHYSNANINNVEFLNNYATGDGGGIYCYDYSSPVFDTVYIKNNTAEGNGGGIYINSYSNPVFHKVNFYSNTANYGGGGLMARLYSDFTMDDVLINANSASYGGGLALHFYCDADISNSNIINNSAVSYPGYPAQGGGVSTTYGSFPVFFNVEVSGNESDNYAGGMYCSSYILFENGKINNNSAQVNGGGIYISGGVTDEKFVNTEICRNQVIDFFGGAIYLSSGTPEFINVTIANNQDFNEEGAGVYARNSNPVFKNSILWDNTPDEILLGSGGNVTAEYSDIEGGWTGTGNIDSNPSFLHSATGNFTLEETSPCIDAGNPDTTGMNLPETDLSGNPRITNDIIDMGAYEYLDGVYTIQLDLNVFLEGPFNGTDMNPSASSGFPLSQPYNIAPWNYDGDESVAGLPNSDIVDWVLVEIRDADYSSNATPSTTIARQAGFLLRDGSAVSLDGSSPLEFNNISIENSFFYLVWHRNHLGIMSSIGNILAGYTIVNFYVSDGAVYNSSSGGYKELAPGIWGMVAGDANGDGNINTADKTLWGTEAGSKGYQAADHNLDSQVDNKDKNDIWLINLGDECQVPE